MPICNVLIKTLGSADGRMRKFLLLLDSPGFNTMRSFEIVPSDEFGFDFVGTIGPLLGDQIFCNGLDDQNSDVLDVILDGTDDPMIVGMQGTGSVVDSVHNTDDILLWKVISISGQPPPSALFP